MGKLRHELAATDIGRKALAVNQAFLALGNERFDADCATFIRNRSLPDMAHANHVTHVSASTPDEIDRLLARVEREFSDLPYRRFDLDFTTPPAFEARLAHEGYRHSDLLVMLLDGELSTETSPCDIRPIKEESCWEAYAALHHVEWREHVERTGRAEDAWNPEAMVRSARMTSPPAKYWLAYVDDEARAYCASWAGFDGVGQIEDLFTHPDYRHRGLASALIQQGVEDCRRHGANAVVILTGTTATSKEMYASLGFRPVALTRHYSKDAQQ